MRRAQINKDLFADQFMSGIQGFVTLSGLLAAAQGMTVNLKRESVKWVCGSGFKTSKSDIVQEEEHWECLLQ